jgi:transposase
MRPYGSPVVLERRRRRGVAMMQEGFTASVVAGKVGASVSSVLRWQEAFQRGGDEALCPRPVPGRPKELGERERGRLWSILLQGALAYGFPNDLWTLKRIARVIRKEFGVKYHPGHVWKILRGEGWSCQVPERRAIQRDEKAVEHWKRYKWPAIKKSPKTWRPPRIR